MTKENNELTQCYIAYFDILGYKEFLDDSENDEFELLNSINLEFSKLNKMGKSRGDSSVGLKVKTFSDNVVMAVDDVSEEGEDTSFYFLSLLLCIIQLVFLERHNLFVRGSLVHGDILINDDMVFGKGLIDAVKIEEGSAKFPRILLGKTIENRFGDRMPALEYVKRDEDGEYYLDFFQAEQIYPEEELNRICLAQIREKLIERLRRNCKYGAMAKRPETIQARENVISKHLWMVEKFNEYCLETGRKDYEIVYSLVLNRRLMKSEVKVDI